MTTDNETLTFVGKIKSIRFFNDDNSWGVITVTSQVEIPYSKSSIGYDLTSNQEVEEFTVVVVGKMPEPVVGNMVSIEGKHVFAEKFKQHQYEIVSITPLQPKSLDEQKAYLRSILTEKQAEVLLSVYPSIVQDVIDGKDNVDLSLLHGIGEYTWNRIKEKIVTNFAISDVLSILIPIGISYNKIQKLLDDEPNPHVLRDKLIKHPYVIADIDGISFKTADKIATQLNPSLKKTEARLIAFLKHRLQEIGDESGDTYTSLDGIRNEIIENVPEVEKFLDGLITKEQIKSKHFHITDDRIALKRIYDAEKFIFDTLVAIHSSKPLEIDMINIENGIQEAEAELGFTFTEEQRSIVFKIAKNNFNVMTGRAGTGKSTLSRAILNAYEQAGYKIGVAALSAKAAIRAQEATGFEATTIHRMLGAQGDGGFTFGINNTLPFDVILIDECSMNNALLFQAILRAVNVEYTKIIFVGDKGQLPPIGAGNIFSDLFDNTYPFDKHELTKIQRQAEKSAIIVDGNLIRQGISPIDQMSNRIVHGELQDLYYMFRGDRASLFDLAISSYMKSVAKKGIENVVLLTPRRQGTLNCTKELNRAIQRAVNAENEYNKFVHGDKEFRLGDRVIHVNNDYGKDVYNGEIGFVIDVERNGMSVEYDGKTISYGHSDINDVELAYALTVHKMQGSQNQDVIIIIDNSHYVLLSNQLLYTAITRAQSRCMVVSEPYAFTKSLEENKNIRNTWLKEFVVDEQPYTATW